MISTLQPPGKRSAPLTCSTFGASPLQQNHFRYSEVPQSNERPEKWKFLSGLVKGFITTILSCEIGYMGVQTLRAHLLQKELRTRAQSRMDTRFSTMKWPDHMKIYAGTTQENYGYFSVDLWGNVNGFSYSDELLCKLNSPGVDSLEKAHLLMKDGVPLSNPWSNPEAQVPVDSLNTARGWKKTEDKPRFVLILTGIPTGDTDKDKAKQEAMFEAQAHRVQETFSNVFRIPPEHFCLKKQPKAKEVEEGIKWLGEEKTRYPGAEVLIYVLSHGTLDGSFNTSSHYPQGRAIGAVCLNGNEKPFQEFVMKRLVQQYLSQMDASALIVDCCYSGAWIAETSPKPSDRT